MVFADDLNAYRKFPGNVPNDKIVSNLRACQAELHSWGKANQVAFDPGMESLHIISKTETYGGNFKLLGVDFDPTLDMKEAIHEMEVSAGWKLRMVIRARCYYTTAELVGLYKSHILSFLEYRTAAIYHAKREFLWTVDRIQWRFLQDSGISEGEALMTFNLAPLSARRDIAMLGIIHRSVLNKGPKHFKQHFKAAPGYRRLCDPRESNKDPIIKRSILGSIAIYNLLPEGIRRRSSVKEFQANLQNLLKRRAADGNEDWQCILSPRQCLKACALRWL